MCIACVRNFRYGRHDSCEYYHYGALWRAELGSVGHLGVSSALTVTGVLPGVTAAGGLDCSMINAYGDNG